jgi:Copper type II ascorbate-dependent monooxygenase, C-terminal domain
MNTKNYRMSVKQIFTAALACMVFAACERKITYDPKDIPAFTGLAVPAKDSGLQVHVPPFPVIPGSEREWYMRMPIGNTEKVYVTGFEAKMRPGTHHFIAYPFPDENAKTNPPIGVMRDQNLQSGRLNFFSNLGMSSFVLESTAPEYRIDLPDGYALPFNANATLDFNSHYFNKTQKMLFGEVFFNLYTKPKTQITGELEEVVTTSGDLDIKPNAQTTVTYTHKFERDSRIVMLTSHYHRRGRKFDIYKVGGANDGELLYSNGDYVHPIINYYDGGKYLSFKKDEGIRVVALYENETSRAVNYGVTSDDEMCIAFMYRIKE